MVKYGNFNEVFLKTLLPNPIEYIYFNNEKPYDDKKGYSEEKEFRISLSCLGICKYQFQDNTEFKFPDSLKLAFDSVEAIKLKVIKEIQISPKCTDKETIKQKLNNLFSEKGIKIEFRE